MNKVKNWILNHRIIFLIITVAIGIGLAFATYYIATCFCLDDERLKISPSLSTLVIPILLALSLPTLLTLLMYKIYDIQKQLDKRVIDWFVDNRKCSLLGAGVLGIGLAIIAYMAAGCLCNEILQSSITILALGLPTFFILWLFRTHDVQEQLKKAEEQLKKTEENTNNSTFFECARLLATKDSPDEDRIENSIPKKIALEQLTYLKRKTSFDKERIDLLTKNRSLCNKEFSHAQLRGLDLSGAELINTSLSGTDLRDAKLIGADLRIIRRDHGQPLQSDLSNADLRNADLSDANLTGAKLTRIKVEGTIYNDKTKFEGTWLNDEEARKAAGMIYQPNEEDPENKSETDI